MSSEHDDDGRSGGSAGADKGAGTDAGPAGDTGGTADDHGQSRPARRSRLTVVAVAAAVLLAGGGGALWVATANGGGNGSGSAKSSGGGPAPLRFDDPGVPAYAEGSGRPDPGSTYQLTGTLPKGPDSAAVYRTTGGVSQDAVRKLAALLGLSGPVVSEQGAWGVGGTADGAGAALLVSKEAPGNWAYSRYGAPMPGARPGAGSATADTSGPAMESGSGSGGGPASGGGSAPATGSAGPASGSGTSQSADGTGPASPGTPRSADGSAPPDSTVISPADPGNSADMPVDTVRGTTGTGGTPPVSEAKAKAVTDPVFDGLGLSGARIDAAQTVGALRMVSADPVVGGLPTHGWATTLQVGSDGVLTAGYGRLAPLGKGATYPVISAADAFRQLDAVRPVERLDDGTTCVVPMPRPQPKVTPTPTVPGQDKTLPRSMPCVPGNGHPTQVRGATFGLSMEFVSGAQTLVPAWLFDTAPAGVSRTTVVAQTAVRPSYIQRGGAGGNAPGGGYPASPAAPVDPGGPMSPGPGGSDPNKPAAPAHRMTVTAYQVKGSTLVLTFWGGVCDTYKATADETATQVRVTVTGTPREPRGMCLALAKEFSESVRLAQPLGHRSVVDTTDGQPVKGQ